MTDAVTEISQPTQEMKIPELQDPAVKTYTEKLLEKRQQRLNGRIEKVSTIQNSRTEKQNQARESFKQGMVTLAKQAENAYVKVTGAPDAIKKGINYLVDSADEAIVQTKLKVNEKNEAAAKGLDARIGRFLGGIQGRMDSWRARMEGSKAIKPDLLLKASQKKQEALQASIDQLQKMLTAEKGNAEAHAAASTAATEKAAELRATATKNKENSTWFMKFRGGLQARLS